MVKIFFKINKKHQFLIWYEVWVRLINAILFIEKTGISPNPLYCCIDTAERTLTSFQDGTAGTRFTLLHITTKNLHMKK